MTTNDAVNLYDNYTEFMKNVNYGSQSNIIPFDSWLRFLKSDT